MLRECCKMPLFPTNTWGEKSEFKGNVSLVAWKVCWAKVDVCFGILPLTSTLRAEDTFSLCELSCKKVAASVDNRLTQCSKPAKNSKKPVFFFFYYIYIYSFRFLDGFERLSVEATFLTPAYTAKMWPLRQGTLDLTPWFKLYFGENFKGGKTKPTETDLRMERDRVI